MDPLLRRVLERRELEAQTLVELGDPIAKLRCTRCGVVLADASKFLRCSRHREASGGRVSKKDRRVWMRFVKARREHLQAISSALDQLISRVPCRSAVQG